MKKGYLVLQDGQVFEGVRFGAEGDTVGELVFTTGMCGYIETLTDPSYAGQIVLQTYPLIGNYGIIREDFEGACCVKGYVVREWCDAPSNFRCDCDLDTYLKEQDVPGLWGGGVPVRVQGQVPPLLFQEGVGGVLHNDDHPAQPPVWGDGEEGLCVLEAFHPGLLADLLPQDRAAGEGTGIAKQALLVGLKEQGEDAFFFGTLQGGQEQRQHMDFTPL